MMGTRWPGSGWVSGAVCSGSTLPRRQSVRQRTRAGHGVSEKDLAASSPGADMEHLNRSTIYDNGPLLYLHR